MTEAYELLKNVHFLDDPCSIQANIKKRLFNSDLEAIINYQLAYCSNHLRIVPKNSSNLCRCWAIILDAEQTTEKRQ